MMITVNMEPLLAFDQEGIPYAWYLVINHTHPPHFYRMMYHGKPVWSAFEYHEPIDAFYLNDNIPVCIILKKNQLICQVRHSEGLSLALCEYYLAKKPLSFPTNELCKMENVTGIAEYIRSGGDFSGIWSDLDPKTQYQVIEHLNALEMLRLGDISDFPQIWQCSRQSDLKTAFLGLIDFNICPEEISLLLQNYPERLLHLYLLFNHNIFAPVDEQARQSCLQKLEEAIYLRDGPEMGERFIEVVKSCIEITASVNDKMKAYRQLMAFVKQEFQEVEKDVIIEMLTDHVLFMAINYQLPKSFLAGLQHQINKDSSLPFLKLSISPDLKKCQKLFHLFMNQEFTPLKARALKERLEAHVNLILSRYRYPST
ncbi:MAG: hypothetical protein EBQ95_00285 [Gammaproteobacteria bacterium]|nr:hypothetical protein [Gammaproteobacteria bacterium]